MSETPNEPTPALRPVAAGDPEWLPQMGADEPEAAPWSDGQPMHLDSIADLDES